MLNLLTVRKPLLLSGILLVTGACNVSEETGSQGGIRKLTVLYTNDEHGFMEGMTTDAGAANLYRLWQEAEGYTADGPFLLLSGGDNWTGPAISTWVDGHSMVEVMNAMDYDASAIGNHEYDFGLQVLADNIARADFPYLSANTFWRSNKQVPTDLGILPYSFIERNGLRIGIVGLTTTSTPRTSNPRNVVELEFGDYETALRATMPGVMAEQPDLLFVIAHVCLSELRPLAERVADLGIDLMGGGHCNELEATRIGDTVLLGGGYHYTAYAKAHMIYDIEADQLLNVSYGTHFNAGHSADPGIGQIVSRWQGRFEGLLGEVIAWSDAEIDYRSDIFRKAVVDAWLWSDPSADVAITNMGGLRTPLPAGAITLNDLVNTMPFENNIIAVNVTGAVMLQAIADGGRPIVGGMSRQDDLWILDKSGLPVDEDQHYRVLVNSFMYDGGDNFQALADYDAEGFDTGMNYRQPLVDWLRGLNTSVARPLSLEDLINNSF